MLCATDISVSYGRKTVLDRVSVDIPPGRITAILGPNGAGKTTLMRVLSGDQNPDNGRVDLFGQTLSGLSAAQLAARRAVLPQDTRPAFGFKAWEIVRLGRSPFSDGAALEMQHVEDALGRVDAVHLAEREMNTLSGGERQRVFLAKALCQAIGQGEEPGYLLLDEPTAALDMKQTSTLMMSLRLAAGTGIGIALITHDVRTMRSRADRLLLVKNSQVTSCETPVEFDKFAIAKLYDMKDAEVAV